MLRGRSTEIRRERQTAAEYLWGPVRPRLRSRGYPWGSAMEISCWEARERICIPGALAILSRYPCPLVRCSCQRICMLGVLFPAPTPSTWAVDAVSWFIQSLFHTLFTFCSHFLHEQLRLGGTGAFPNVAEMPCSLWGASTQ